MFTGHFVLFIASSIRKLFSKKDVLRKEWEIAGRKSDFSDPEYVDPEESGEEDISMDMPDMGSFESTKEPDMGDICLEEESDMPETDKEDFYG